MSQISSHYKCECTLHGWVYPYFIKVKSKITTTTGAMTLPFYLLIIASICLTNIHLNHWLHLCMPSTYIKLWPISHATTTPFSSCTSTTTLPFSRAIIIACQSVKEYSDVNREESEELDNPVPLPGWNTEVFAITVYKLYYLCRLYCTVLVLKPL